MTATPTPLRELLEKALPYVQSESPSFRPYTEQLREQIKAALSARQEEGAVACYRIHYEHLEPTGWTDGAPSDYVREYVEKEGRRIEYAYKAPIATPPASGEAGRHRWQPDADVEGAVYCPRCDCTRRVAEGAEPRWDDCQPATPPAASGDDLRIVAAYAVHNAPEGSSAEVAGRRLAALVPVEVDDAMVKRATEAFCVGDPFMPYAMKRALLAARLAALVPDADQRVQNLEQFLGRIFAAQRVNAAGEYCGWKISGAGSLNEVVEEARLYLDCPLMPAHTKETTDVR